MGAAVSITRLDLTASELRKAASGEKDSAAARRIRCANCRSGPATQGPTKKPRRHLKKLRDDAEGPSRPSAEAQTDRTLVPDAMRTG